MNRYWVLILVVCVVLGGCSVVKPDESTVPTTQATTGIEQPVSTEAQQEAVTVPTLLSSAYDVVETLKNQDMVGFSKWVHPSLGVRFSPYTFVDVKADLVFQAQQLVGVLEDNAVLNWGNFDGSGEPINLTASQYLKDFVYDRNYLEPQMIGLNTSIGQGNSTNNIADAYPDAKFVEFHFKGIDPQYEGIDWSSLVVVMQEIEGKWYVVGIVHMAWTI